MTSLDVEVCSCVDVYVCIPGGVACELKFISFMILVCTIEYEVYAST